MQAVVSGRMGVALLKDGDRVFSLHVYDSDNPVEQHPEGASRIFDGATDLEFLEVADQTEALAKLELANDAEDALHIALSAMDDSLPESLRKEAVEELENLLSNGKILARVENTLYAHELPPSADLATAERLCKEENVEITSAFFTRLRVAQPHIKEVRLAWVGTSGQLMESQSDRDQFQELLIRNGFFRDFVQCRTGGKTTNGLLMHCLSDSSLQKIPNHREIVQRWVGQLEVRPETRRPIDRKAKKQAKNTRNAKAEKGKGRRKRIDREAVLKSVEKQKSECLKALKKGNRNRFWKLVDGLLEFHASHGGGEFASKSLCDLAMAVKEFGDLDIQLELTSKAVEQNDKDATAWSQQAHALLAANMFKGALEASQRAIDLDPGDPVARRGRAEVLKAMGRYEDALDVYNKVITEHPEDMVARNGRAYLLAKMERWDEALRELPFSTPSSDQDWIGYHIRGMILLRKGGESQLDEALIIFEDGAKNDPRPDSRAYFQTALVMARIRREEYQEADEALEALQSSKLKDLAGALRIQVCGELKQRKLTEQAFRDRPAFLKNGQYKHVGDELERRYITHPPVSKISKEELDIQLIDMVQEQAYQLAA
jgi:tetratricopeptide (TPR) repeat protein